MSHRTESRRILINLLHYPVHTLGPGRRVGLWLQGCSIHCEGCISQHTWPFDERYAMPVEELADRIEAFGKTAELPPDGLTVSGGEPFDQAEAFFDLLRTIRSRGLKDVLVFSGYRVQDLLKRYPYMPGLITTLVDGSFELGNETDAGWKGSGNQSMTLFQPEYEKAYSKWAASGKGALQFIESERRFFIAGIPFQKDVPEIRKRIELSFQTSEMK